MRSRSITIYAESAEEYATILDEEAEDHFKPRQRRSKHRQFHPIDEDSNDLYSSLGVSSLADDIIPSEDESYSSSSSSSEEEQFIDQLPMRAQKKKPTIAQQQEGIELLCLYLKHSIGSEQENKTDGIFYKNKSFMHTLSGNAIYDLNIRELVDDIITDNENDLNTTKATINNNDTMPITNSTLPQNSLKEFIIQNIPQEDKVKVMIISNNSLLKNDLVRQYFQSKELPMSSFEIRHKIARLFGKTISVQLFDTEAKFHSDPTSHVYYKLSDAFIILIDASIQNSLHFLKELFKNINSYSKSKNVIVVAKNLFYELHCSIDGDNLKEYVEGKGMIYIAKNNTSYTSSNEDSSRIGFNNLLSLIVITKVDKAIAVNSSKSQYHQSGPLVHNSLGFNKNYRIRQWNAFDSGNGNIISHNSNENIDRRKWSSAI